MLLQWPDGYTEYRMPGEKLVGVMHHHKRPTEIVLCYNDLEVLKHHPEYLEHIQRALRVS